MKWTPPILSYIRFATLIFLMQSVNSFASSPTGDTFSPPQGKWQQSWSESFFKCLARPESKTLMDKLSSGQVKDVGRGKSGNPWCATADVNSQPSAKEMLLTTFKVLAGYESSYNPAADNPNSPNGHGLGLFQIGVGDTKNHNCTGPNGESPSESELKTGEFNICCAVKIASDQATGGPNSASESASTRHGGAAPDQLAEGKQGILADFWEPIRDQNSAGAKAKVFKDNLNRYCTNFSDQQGGLLTAAEMDACRNGSSGSSVSSPLAPISGGGANW